MSVASKEETQLSPAEFDIVRKTLDRETAIQIGEGQEYLIESRLIPVIRQNELGSLSEVVSAICGGDRTVINLTIDAMTKNETLFFRDTHPFETIKETLLPALFEADANRTVTIWCAACSSGQAPYSLAMLLSERFPTAVRNGKFRIVATDLSASMIDFSEHNLLGSWASLPRCDIVLMRNVLIYFTIEVKTRLLSQVRTQVLQPGGALFLGSSETTINVDDTFQREQYGKSVAYRAP